MEWYKDLQLYFFFSGMSLQRQLFRQQRTITRRPKH